MTRVQVLASLVLSAAVAASAQAATVLFSQDFSNGAAAAAQFETHGWATFSYTSGVGGVINSTDTQYPAEGHQKYNAGGWVITNAANSFTDSGAAPIVYSMTYSYQGGGAEYGSMFFRTDGYGTTFSDTNYANRSNYGWLGAGYDAGVYWDSANWILILRRFNAGIETTLSAALNAPADQVLATYGPLTLSVEVTNTPTSVDLAFYANGSSTPFDTYSDTSAGRITSGQGMGYGFIENGSSIGNQITVSNLSATVPEPTTLSLVGLAACGLLARRRK